MAVTSIDQLKSFFSNLSTPQQEQFWAIFESFRHKSYKITSDDLEPTILNIINRSLSVEQFNDSLSQSGLPKTSNRVYASNTNAPTTDYPHFPLLDATTILNQALRDLSDSGGGEFIFDRGYNANIIWPSNVIIRRVTGGFIVNGTQAGKPILRNANFTAGPPTDKKLIFFDDAPGTTFLYCGRYLGANGIHETPDKTNYRTFSNGGNPNTWQFHRSIDFQGVDGLYLNNLSWEDPSCFGLQMFNVQNAVLNNPTQKFTRIPENWLLTGPNGETYNNDGIRILPKCRFITINDAIIRTSDDGIACNCEPGNMAPYGKNSVLLHDQLYEDIDAVDINGNILLDSSGSPRYGWMGDIEDVTVNGGKIVQSLSGVRVYGYSKSCGVKRLNINGLNVESANQFLMCENFMYGGGEGCVSDSNISLIVKSYGNGSPAIGEAVANDTWVRISHFVDNVKIKITAQNFYDPNNRPFVSIVDVAGHTDVNVQIEINRTDAKNAPVSSMFRLAGGIIRKLDIGNTVWHLDPATIQDGNLIQVNGANVQQLRSGNLDLKRTGNVIQMLSGNLDSVQIPSLRHVEYTEGTKFIEMPDNAVIGEALIDNYAGPLDNTGVPVINVTPTGTLVKAYFKLDETTGNRVDTVNPANILTPINGVGYTAGKIGNAISLTNASNQFMLGSNSNELYSIDNTTGYAFWADIHIVPYSTDVHIIACKENANGTQKEHLLYYAEGHIYFLASTDGGVSWNRSVQIPYTPTGQTTQVKAQVVVLPNGGKTMIIFTGDATDAMSNGYTNEVYFNGTAPFTLGAELSTPSVSFNGWIDEVGLMKIPFTSEFISYVYNSGNGRRPLFAAAMKKKGSSWLANLSSDAGGVYVLPSPVLIAKWDMNDLSDAQGKYTLTNNNGVTFGSGGKVGNGASLNGGNQSLSNDQIGIDLGSNFTMYIWVKRSRITTEVICAQYGNGGINSKFQIVTSGSSLYLGIVNSQQTSFTATAVIPSDINYYLLTVKVSGRDRYAKIKVNNGAWANVNFTGFLASSTLPFYVGCNLDGANNTPNNFLQARIDAIQVYSGITDDAKDNSIYNSGNGVE